MYKKAKWVGLKSIIGLSLYMILIFGLCAFMTSHSLFTYMSANKSVFKVTNKLISADIQFRITLQQFYERFLLFNTLLFTDVYKGLPLEAKTKRIEYSRLAFKAAQDVFSTQDPFPEMINEANLRKREFSRGVIDLLMEEEVGNANENLRNLVLKPSILVTNYGVLEGVLENNLKPLVNFFWKMQAGMDYMEREFTKIEPFARGKQPPFNIPPEIVENGFFKFLPTFLDSLQNSFDGVQENIINVLKRLMKSWTSERLSLFKNKFSVWLSLTVVFFGIYLLGVVLISIKIGRRIFWVMTQLQNLTADEVQTHRDTLSSKLLFFKDTKFHEMKMITHTLTKKIKTNSASQESKTVSQSQNLFIKGKKGLVKKQELQQKQLQQQRQFNRNQYAIHRNKKMKYNKWFKISKLMIFFGIFAMILIGIFLTFVIIEGRNLIITSDRIVSYFKANVVIFKAANFYLYNSLFLIFGNYIKVNGEFLEDRLKNLSEHDPIQNLITFFVSRRSVIPYLMHPLYAPKFDSLLFTNICEHIPKDRPTHSTELKACLAFPPASEGLVSFMADERDTLRYHRSFIFKDTTFLDKSKRDYNLFPFQDYVFGHSSLQFRVVQKITFETTMGLLSKAGKYTVTQKMETIQKHLLIVGENFLVGIVFIYTLSFLTVALLALRKDQELCAETFRLMNPETIASNQTVLASFKKTFITHFKLGR